MFLTIPDYLSFGPIGLSDYLTLMMFLTFRSIGPSDFWADYELDSEILLHFAERLIVMYVTVNSCKHNLVVYKTRKLNRIKLMMIEQYISDATRFDISLKSL